MTIVERSSRFLATRLSRRSFINRSAIAGSAVAVGAGADLLLRPGTAYGLVCSCGNGNCDCDSTCCSGFSEFCCSVNGGYNYCPTGTIMGGWWKADNSSYCNGPRYYMDCNAVCTCDDGCGGGFAFCDPGCDGVNCGCGPLGCDSYVTGCFQFRYGQCNQQVECMGRIVCRVVACVPPWTVDPTCTTTNAEDDSTAEQNEPCWTPAPPAPPPTPCASMLTRCQVVGMASATERARLRHGHRIREGVGFRLLRRRRRRVVRRAGPARGGHRRPAGRRLLAGGGGRWHLRLRRRPLLRIDGWTPAQPADGLHGRHAVERRLLAGGGGRRHLRLRRRPLLRVDGGPDAQQAHRGHGRHARPATATGSWRPTAVCSPSATPASTGRWVARCSTSRLWAWPPPRPGSATGWWLPTAASSPSGTPLSEGRWAVRCSTSPSWAWPRRTTECRPAGPIGLLAGGGRRRHLRLQCPVLRIAGMRNAPGPRAVHARSRRDAAVPVSSCWRKGAS